MHEMTSSGEYFFLAVAETFQGKRGISKYGHFRIENEENFYKLHFNKTLLEGIHSLDNEYVKQNVNGMKFTTVRILGRTSLTRNCYRFWGNYYWARFA